MSKSKDAATPAPQEILPPLPGQAGKTGKGGKTPTPESDPELAGLMSEIEADLREEELHKLWKRHGKLVIAAFVLAVMAVIGFQLWRQEQVEQRLEVARRYEQAQAEFAQGKADDAIAIFADVSKARGEGYAALASLNRAGILIQQNDLEGAVAVYKSIAADDKVDPVFRDLATTLQALHTLDTADPKSLTALLSPLANPANPFHNMALELSAMVAAREGDYARAADLAGQLAIDSLTPPTMRVRAQDLAAYYKAQAANPPPASPPSTQSSPPTPTPPKP